MNVADHPLGALGPSNPFKKTSASAKAIRTQESFASEVAQHKSHSTKEITGSNEDRAAKDLEQKKAREGQTSSSDAPTEKDTLINGDESVPFGERHSLHADDNRQPTLREGVEDFLKRKDREGALPHPDDLILQPDKDHALSGKAAGEITGTEVATGQGASLSLSNGDAERKDGSIDFSSGAKSMAASESIGANNAAVKTSLNATEADTLSLETGTRTNSAAPILSVSDKNPAKLKGVEDLVGLKGSRASTGLPEGDKTVQQAMLGLMKVVENRSLSQSQEAPLRHQIPSDADVMIQPGNAKPDASNAVQEFRKANTGEPQSKAGNLTSMSLDPSSPIGSAFSEDPFLLGTTSERQISQVGLRAGHIGLPTQALNMQPVNQVVAAAIDAKINGTGTDTIDLMLEPQELGRLRITLITRETGLFVMLSAERNETLDLLRRNADELRTNLESLDLGGAQLDFEHRPNDPQWLDKTEDTASEVVVSLIPKSNHPLVNALSPDDRLDLRL